jgi:MYXO-CTERM domain-containing protein
MTTQRNLFKVMVMAAVVSIGFLTARRASACTNDIECPNNTACGGEICDWTKLMTCGPAGLSPKGMDGWCAADSDCKCFAQGARCVQPYCTFTLPSQAPGGGASGGASGSSGGTTGSSGGASGSTGGASGSTGGATGSGGTSSDAGTKAADSGGGCAVAGKGVSYSWLAALGGLAAVLAARRRRST